MELPDLVRDAAKLLRSTLPATIDLRVNLVKLTREEALERLGLGATPTPHSPAGIRLKGKPQINRHALFLDGSVEVQDEGSQLLCSAVVLQPLRRVFDGHAAKSRRGFEAYFFILHSSFSISPNESSSTYFDFYGARLSLDAVAGKNILVRILGPMPLYAELLGIRTGRRSDARGGSRKLACGQARLPLSSVGRRGI